MATGLQLPAAMAHDYWIQAEPYRSDRPTEVNITLHVGTDLVGRTLPNIAAWYRDFSYRHAGQSHPMPGEMGDDPAGRLPANTPGLYLVGYENLPEHIELKAEKFNHYLEDEGLQAVARWRASNGQADKPGREYYQRCAKSLVRIGKQAISVAELQHPLGYRLEILPEGNPYRDQQLPIQLLYNGKPQPDLLVMAFTRDEPKRRQQVRTDAQGRAQIELDRAGEWLIKTVHMVPYTEDDTGDNAADWISFWASLTFER